MKFDTQTTNWKIFDTYYFHTLFKVKYTMKRYSSSRNRSNIFASSSIFRIRVLESYTGNRCTYLECKQKFNHVVHFTFICDSWILVDRSMVAIKVRPHRFIRSFVLLYTNGGECCNSFYVVTTFKVSTWINFIYPSTKITEMFFVARNLFFEL